VGYSISTVSRSIKRINEVGNVADYERSGRPALYSEELRLKLIGFYCQTQPLPNSGRWTIRWAATHLEQHPEIINARPSKSTIQRILKENNLKPHQSRYFLHITDPDFFPKMNHLIDLYLNPPQNLFFFDECPGIQILKRLTPDIRTDETAKTLEEFEYIRNGTMNVLAFFNYADGKVHADCKADHKTDTFLEMFKKHVSYCLSGSRKTETEKLYYVMDNLSTHRGYPFCEVVAELSGITCPPQTVLNSLGKRVEWLSSPDKKIIIHFTPYHGSWLNLVEFWFGIMNKATIYNVALQAGVSLATVSRTLNNPEKVKLETRERVLKVIEELGYKPNAFAKGLASRKSTSVAVIVPDMSRSSIAEMVNGIAVEARKYQYSLIIYVLNEERLNETEMLKEVVASQADGILYMNDEINEEQYAMLNTIQEDYKVPIVLANTQSIF